MLSVFDQLIDPRSCVRHTYRVCAVGRDGELASFIDVEADDDAEAVHLSRPLGAFHAVELWDGARFMARFGPGETVRWGELATVSKPQPTLSTRRAQGR